MLYPNIEYNEEHVRSINQEEDTKKINKTPFWVQKKLALLAKDLRDTGPEQTNWQNYSKLGAEKYHCHLGSSWVACWEHETNTIEIEVYYVGSREKAPY